MSEASSPGITKRDLLLGFMKIGLLGFGGVASMARYVIVEEREWFTDEEYAAILGICQVMPGPNTVNSAVIIGDRFQGVPGVLLSLLGLMLAPVIIVTLLGAAFSTYGNMPDIQAAIMGAAAGGAGLVVGTGFKMVQNIGLGIRSSIVAAAAFVSVGVMNWPMIPVVAVLVPVSIGLVLLERR